jgi:hypothetical protein
MSDNVIMLPFRPQDRYQYWLTEILSGYLSEMIEKGMQPETILSVGLYALYDAWLHAPGMDSGCQHKSFEEALEGFVAASFQAELHRVF